MDHFARPDDDLALALADGRLQRNFMGYTTSAGTDLIGLGMSAISEHDGLLVQQRAALAPWYRAVRGEEALVEKGWALTADDRLRRDVIHALMCAGALDLDDVAATHGEPAAASLLPDLEALTSLQRDGLVVRDDRRVTLTPTGRLLSRTVARVFDRHTGGTHSRAV
jgi:oxygen-independent coproporphyrinogen-3 oxidase